MREVIFDLHNPDLKEDEVIKGFLKKYEEFNYPVLHLRSGPTEDYVCFTGGDVDYKLKGHFVKCFEVFKKMLKVRDENKKA